MDSEELAQFACWAIVVFIVVWLIGCTEPEPIDQMWASTCDWVECYDAAEVITANQTALTTGDYIETIVCTWDCVEYEGETGAFRMLFTSENGDCFEAGQVWKIDECQ